MRKTLFALLLLASTAQASPWLVCDPQPGIDGYAWSLDGGEWSEQPYTLLDADSAIVCDLKDVLKGNHTIQVKAFKNDSLWGRMESETVPFGFARPSSSKPINMGLKK